MLTELDVGNKTKSSNVKQPMNDNKRMKTLIKDGETKENMQMKKMLEDVVSSIIKKDLAELKVEISDIKLQLKGSKQNPENF